MSLLGWPLLTVLAVAAVGVLVVTPLCWQRWPGPVAWPARFLCLALVAVLPMAVTSDLVNRNYGFYTSWGDLFSAPTDVRLSAVAQLRHERISPEQLADGAAASAAGHGTLLNWTLPGARSGISRPGVVYLPAAYFDRSRPTEQFPVVELLHGYSGSPGNWTRALHIRDVLDAEIAAGRIPPVIAVAPKTYDTHDGECVNAVRGEQNETYLAVDVPHDLATAFRTATVPGSWAALGFSTGGFCAVNMALHHPGTYRAAASLSGYFTAVTDRTTGDLYRGDAAVRRDNSPQWWVRHHGLRPGLYVFASGGDRGAYAAVRPFRRAVPAGADLTTVTVPTGGHNVQVWRAALAPALDWLGARLPSATSTPLVERGSHSDPRRPSA